MDKNQLISEILLLPIKMKSSPCKSFYAYVMDIQNESAGIELSCNDIRDALKSHSNFIQDWIVYSEDQRCSDAWYFRKSESTAYEVGLYVDKEGYKFVTMYEDAALACAVFIQKSLSDYMKITGNGVTHKGTHTC